MVPLGESDGLPERIPGLSRNFPLSTFNFQLVLKRPEKEKLVTELADLLRAAPAVVVASFKALTMAESAKLRRTLRPAGGKVRVIPKRLFRRVAETLGWPAGFAETGDSIAVAWSADLLLPAKSVHTFVKATKDARFLGGILDGRPLAAAEVEQLALLPPLEQLRAQFVGLVAYPLRGIVGVFGSVLRGLPAVLHARSLKSQES